VNKGKIRMKKLLGMIVTAFILVAPPYAFCGQVNDTKVKRLVISKGFGNIMFVETEDAKDSKPACHTNGSWTYVLSMNDELGSKMMTMLLTAKASGATIILAGSEACDAFGSIESLNYISIK
jgi:hypothetical protein